MLVAPKNAERHSGSQENGLSNYRYGFNGKESDDEVSGQGNSYEYGARMYNPRVGRWFAVDPYFKEYAPMSPYSFALLNPIKLLDADGNVIVDENGNPITYTQNQDGTITWSSNVTDDVRRVGDAMLKTPKGKEILDQMIATKETTIHIIITKPNTINQYALEQNGSIRDDFGAVFHAEEYEYIQDNDYDPCKLEDRYDFDPETGLWVMKEGAGELYILLNGKKLGELVEGESKRTGMTSQQKEEFLLGSWGGHEGFHSLDKTFEFTNVKQKKDGTYESKGYKRYSESSEHEAPAYEINEIIESQYMEIHVNQGEGNSQSTDEGN